MPVGWFRQRFNQGLYTSTADVIVYLDDNNVAWAVDGKTKEAIAHSNDHAYVIQEAINSLTNGGKVYVGSGTYSLLSKREIGATGLYASVVIKNGVRLVGSGIGRTILKLGDGLGSNVIGVIDDYSSVCCLTVDGNKTNNIDSGTDGDLTGIYTSFGSHYYLIVDVEAQNCVRQGFYLHGSWASFLNLISHDNNREGIVIDAPDYSQFINLKSIRNGLHGIYIIGGSSLTEKHSIINGIISYGNQGYGLYINYVINMEIGNIDVRHNGFGGTYKHNIFISNSKGLVIRGITSTESYADGIYLYESDDCIVDGGYIFNNSQEGAGLDDAIRIYNGNRNRIVGLVIEDTQSNPTQTYGIREDGISDYNLFMNCVLNVDNPVRSYIGANTKFINNYNYKTFNTGQSVFSGDGTTTQFTIAHGLVSAPSKVLVTPCSADAVGSFYVTADDTNIYVNYSTAPPSGTDNVCLNWYAEI